MQLKKLKKTNKSLIERYVIYLSVDVLICLHKTLFTFVSQYSYISKMYYEWFCLIFRYFNIHYNKMTSTSLVGNRRVLEYEGSNFLRLRLVLATLSGKPIRIRNIRAKSTMPGLTESEASLIRLFDKITNGSKLEVNETGTSLYYQPGKKSVSSTERTDSK